MFGGSGKKLKSILDYSRPKIKFSPQVPPLEKSEQKQGIDIRYCLVSPFAYAHIYWDYKEKELFYELEEPSLTEKEKEYKDEVTEAMESMINFNVMVEKETEKLLDYIDQRFKVLAFELGLDLNYESYKKIYYYLARDFVGMNEVEALLKDFFIEDIECNGVDYPIYIVHRYYGNIRTNVKFDNLARAQSFVEKLAQRAGKYISYSQPILDGSLPDGSRANATYTKDVTSRGPSFTIRKFTEVPWTPPQVLSFRTLSLEMMAYLWMLVEHKMNILVSGGTASGKTTLLNVLAFFIPPESRVVSIEDSRELNLSRENWLPSVARGSTGAGKMGEVSLFQLLKTSFRQRPDYIVVGEVRGKETFVLFQGMASGHPSMSTLHAESVETVIKRLETPPIELSPTLVNVLDCVCVMTHATINNNETRRLKEIAEVVNVDDKGVAFTNKPFVWNPTNDSFYFKRNSKAFEKIEYRFGKSKQEIHNEFQRRVKLLYNLTRDRVFGFKKFQEIVNEYYQNPQKVLRDYRVQ